MGFIPGSDRTQPLLLPARIDDYVAADAPVRVIDAFVDSLNLLNLGFERTRPAETGRPGYDPGDMLKLYIYGYLSNLRSSRRLEKACLINLELSGGYGKQVMVELEHLRDLLRADHNADKRGPNGKDMAEFLNAARYYVYKRPDAPGNAGYILNFYTTEDLKRQIFSGFRDAHMNDALVLNSMALAEEMMSVVQDGSTIGAPGRQKDDRVFASCLGNHAWVQHIRPGMIMQGLTYKRVSEEEAGIRTGGHIVDRTVQQTLETFRNYERGVAEKPPEQAWFEARGLS